MFFRNATSTGIRMFNTPIFKQRASLIIGSSFGVYLLQNQSSSNAIWKNDVLSSSKKIPTLGSNSQLSIDNKSPLASATGIDSSSTTPQYDGAFGGRLNYQELSIGSIVGLFSGFVVGKLSHVLWVVTLSSYLLLQWLNSRNIINVKFNKIVKLGTSQVDLQKMIFEKPSFNLTFLLAFIVTAWNV